MAIDPWIRRAEFVTCHHIADVDEVNVQMWVVSLCACDLAVDVAVEVYEPVFKPRPLAAREPDAGIGTVKDSGTGVDTRT